MDLKRQQELRRVTMTTHRQLEQKNIGLCDVMHGCKHKY